VDEQEGYRSGKYDEPLEYPGYPDAGIRFYFNPEKTSFITIRPSGTGPQIRFYVHLFFDTKDLNEAGLNELKKEAYAICLEVTKKWIRIIESKTVLSASPVISLVTEKDEEIEGIKAVIFDVDGVVIKSIGLHYLAFKEVFKSHGIHYTKEDHIEYMEGQPGEFAVGEIFKIKIGVTLEDEQIQNILTEYKKILLEIVEKEGVKKIAYKSTIKLIGQLKKLGVRVAFGSAGITAKEILGKLGFSDPEYHIITSENLPGISSKKEIFERAAQVLGISKDEWNKVVVIEDTPSAIEAAKDLGMKTIGVGRTQEEYSRLAQRADIIDDDLGGMEIIVTSAGSPISKEVVKLGSKLFNTALKSDLNFGGYIKPGGPRYGQSMDEAIRIIDNFFRTHMGNNHLNYKGPVEGWLLGIGGQGALPRTFASVENQHPNRRLHYLDTLAINWDKYIRETVEILREHIGEHIEEDIIDLFLKCKEPYKLFIIAGSKSGTTDETMTNFQGAIKAFIHIVFRLAYGEGEGSTKAKNMISKLFTGQDFFNPEYKGIDELKEEEKKVLEIILKRLIVATGEWDEDKGEGSRLDRLKISLAKKGYTLTTLGMAPDLGGRSQDISPNGFAVLTLKGYDVRPILEAAREIAKRQLEEGDKNEEVKLAKQIKEQNIEKVIIGIPNYSIYGQILEGLVQKFAESLGKGRVAGYPVGLAAYGYTFQEMINAFRNVKDTSGSRLYLLITDPHLSKEDETAIRKIKKTQKELGNRIIELKLQEQSAVELAKLSQKIEHTIISYGLLNVAEVMLNTDKITVPEEVRKKLELKNKDTKLEPYNENKHDLRRIVSGEGNLSDEEKLLRWIYLLYAPHLQPDVEAAKQLLKGEDGIAFRMFNPEGKKDENGLPIRDGELRREWYEENIRRVEKGPRIVEDSVYLNINDKYQEVPTKDIPKISYQRPVEEVDLNRVKEILREIKGAIFRESQYLETGASQSIKDYRQSSDYSYRKIQDLFRELQKQLRNLTTYEETAIRLSWLLGNAYSKGKAIHIMHYTEIDENFELLRRFARFLGIEKYDAGSKEQHVSKQYSVGGPDAGFELIVNSIKPLEKVKEQEMGTIKNDGCVPQYLHDLYSYEEMIAYSQAYNKTFEKRGVEKAVLEVKDSSEDEGLIEMLALLTQASELAASSSSSSLTITKPGGIDLKGIGLDTVTLSSSSVLPFDPDTFLGLEIRSLQIRPTDIYRFLGIDSIASGDLPAGW